MRPSTPTDEIVSAVDEVLRRLPAHRRATFSLRLERWWDDLTAPLVELYGAPAAAVLARDLVVLAATAYQGRDESLHLLDERRLPRPHYAGRLGAHPARGLPRLRPGQLHLGRRRRRLGVDHLQRVAVGRQLDQSRSAA